MVSVEVVELYCAREKCIKMSSRYLYASHEPDIIQYTKAMHNILMPSETFLVNADVGWKIPVEMKVQSIQLQKQFAF